jgi:hypothetical protein
VIDPNLIWRDKTLLARVKRASESAVRKVLPDLSTTSRWDAGGVIRNVTVGTLNQFGALATVTATQSYTDMRESAAPTATALRTSTAYKPADDVIESVVGYSMATFVNTPETLTETLSVAIGRAVANDYRVTGVNLSDADPIANGFQRVASANACEFCSLLTLSTYTSWEDDAGFHDHCECTTVPVFKGQDPFRPAYYDDMEQEVLTAESEIRAYRASVEPGWREAWQAAGGRMGKNLNRDFLTAYPEAAINNKNILARMRAARSATA